MVEHWIQSTYVGVSEHRADVGELVDATRQMAPPDSASSYISCRSPALRSSCWPRIAAGQLALVERERCGTKLKLPSLPQRAELLSDLWPVTVARVTVGPQSVLRPQKRWRVTTSLSCTGDTMTSRLLQRPQPVPPGKRGKRNDRGGRVAARSPYELGLAQLLPIQLGESVHGLLQKIWCRMRPIPAARKCPHRQAESRRTRSTTVRPAARSWATTGAAIPSGKATTAASNSSRLNSSSTCSLSPTRCSVYSSKSVFPIGDLSSPVSRAVKAAKSIPEWDASKSATNEPTAPSAPATKTRGLRRPFPFREIPLTTRPVLIDPLS